MLPGRAKLVQLCFRWRYVNLPQPVRRYASCSCVPDPSSLLLIITNPETNGRGFYLKTIHGEVACTVATPNIIGLLQSPCDCDVTIVMLFVGELVPYCPTQPQGVSGILYCKEKRPSSEVRQKNGSEKHASARSGRVNNQFSVHSGSCWVRSFARQLLTIGSLF